MGCNSRMGGDLEGIRRWDLRRGDYVGMGVAGSVLLDGNLLEIVEPLRENESHDGAQEVGNERDENEGDEGILSSGSALDDGHIDDEKQEETEDTMTRKPVEPIMASSLSLTPP